MNGFAPDMNIRIFIDGTNSVRACQSLGAISRVHAKWLIIKMIRGQTSLPEARPAVPIHGNAADFETEIWESLTSTIPRLRGRRFSHRATSPEARRRRYPPSHRSRRTPSSSSAKPRARLRNQHILRGICSASRLQECSALPRVSRGTIHPESGSSAAW